MYMLSLMYVLWRGSFDDFIHYYPLKRHVSCLAPVLICKATCPFKLGIDSLKNRELLYMWLVLKKE